ncbi:pyruvate kinase [Candidatus Woesearchaeota archaeon]|nr:pyruvate kinase [Candidatus Woesearchaeota archaeon]
MRYTKIVATIGPACDTKIDQLIKHGVDVARLNFSHGNYDYFKKVIKQIRNVNSLIPILLDTKGPEVRIGDIKPTQIEKNSFVNLVPFGAKLDLGSIPLSYTNLSADVKKGDKLMIDDGKLILRVERFDGKTVVCKALDSHVLLPRKSVDVLGGSVSLPDLTLQDKKDISFGVKQGVDIIAVSLVRNAKTITQVRKLAPKQFIVAKIEHPEAVKNFDAILSVSDGIMIARGDLGLTVPTEKVPTLQKKMIDKCNLAGKPVIVATQMLDSMTTEPIPTRAEASDVANAVFDGVDALMLSGETASGDYPIESVKMMEKIAHEADAHLKEKSVHIHKSKETMVESMCVLITEAAHEMNVKAIITPTVTGYTSRLLAKYRPKIPIVGITRNLVVGRTLNLSKGVRSFVINKPTAHSQIKECIDEIVDLHNLKKSDLVIVAYNNSQNVSGTTNVFEIREVKELM